MAFHHEVSPKIEIQRLRIPKNRLGSCGSISPLFKREEEREKNTVDSEKEVFN